MHIHEILLVVTLILELQNGKPIGSATGFFYHKDNTTYLVTSRHVVIDEEKSHRPEQLMLILHSDPKDISKSEEFKVELYRDGKPLWHDHPAYPELKVDIAVVELDQKQLKKNHVLKALSKQSFFPGNLVVMPGEDVFIMGYPRGKYDTAHNLPLMRNAMVSSVYGLPFQSKPCFLVDANLHPGMSGSPVLTKPSRDYQDKDGKTVTSKDLSIYFLGVFSGTLNVRYRDGEEEPLGLGAVWYPNLIENVIDSISK